jgi:hypothetical protein
VTHTKLATPPGDDRLVLRAELTLGGTADPVATGARLVLGDTTGVLVDLDVPAGPFDPGTGTGWKARKGAFKTTVNPAGALGAAKVKVKTFAATPGRVRVDVMAKQGSWPGDPADLPLAFTVAVGGAGCGDATFAGPSPAPACTYRAPRGKIICR